VLLNIVRLLNISAMSDICTRSCDAGRCMPLRFLLGAQKAGTTSTWGIMPQGCGATEDSRKESHYFALCLKGDDRPCSRASYVHLYLSGSCRSDCFVEATPQLHIPDLPITLWSMQSDWERRAVRFLVLLREPVSRDLSFFNMMHSPNATLVNQLPNPSTAESYDRYSRVRVQAWNVCTSSARLASSIAAQYDACSRRSWAESNHATNLALGMYAPQLQNWFKYWPREQFLVLDSGRALANPQYKMQVMTFFGIPRAAWRRTRKLPHYNSQEHEQKVKMIWCSTKGFLQHFYAPFNAWLDELQISTLQNLTLSASVPCYRN
jgi:lipopolysaccharide transport system ATP-binding protein